jgi:hypothetical protein
MSNVWMEFTGTAHRDGKPESVTATISHPVAEGNGLFRCDIHISWPEDTTFPARATSEAEVKRTARMQLLTQMVALGVKGPEGGLGPLEILGSPRSTRKPTDGREGILCLLEKDGQGGALLRTFQIAKVDSKSTWECGPLHSEKHLKATTLSQSPMDGKELESIGVTVLARLLTIAGM